MGSQTQESITGSAPMSFWGSKIGSITVCPEDHVAGMIMDASSGMSGTIVLEELCQGLHGGLGTLGLLDGKGAKGNK